MLTVWLTAVWLGAAASAGGGLEPVPFTTLAQGNESAIEEPREAVVRTTAEWKALWARHAPDQPMPAVDFSNSMVVGVFAGFRNTAGFRVEITAIEATGDGVIVTWRESRPAPDAILAQVITYPFHLVRTGRTDARVTFRRAP